MWKCWRGAHLQLKKSFLNGLPEGSQHLHNCDESRAGKLMETLKHIGETSAGERMGSMYL